MLVLVLSKQEFVRLAPVDFTRCLYSEADRRHPVLPVLLTKLTELHARLVNNTGLSLRDELRYCDLLLHWLHEFLLPSDADADPNRASGSTSLHGTLWFPLPGGNECNCVWSELFFRTYRCAARLLRFAATEDTVHGGWAETALPYAERRDLKTLLWDLKSLLDYLEERALRLWREHADVLPAIGLPSDYRQTLRSLVFAYTIWNSACMLMEDAAQILVAGAATESPTGSTLDSVPSDDLDLSGFEEAADPTGRTRGSYGPKLTKAARIAAYGTASNYGSCAANPHSPTLSLDSENIHPLDRPSLLDGLVLPSQRDHVAELVRTSASWFFTVNRLLHDLGLGFVPLHGAGGAVLCLENELEQSAHAQLQQTLGTSYATSEMKCQDALRESLHKWKRQAEKAARKGTVNGHQDPTPVLQNGMAYTVSLDSHEPMICHPRDLQQGPEPWSQTARHQFLVALSRVSSLCGEPGEALAFRRAAIKNGEYFLGSNVCERAAQRTMGTIPPSCKPLMRGRVKRCDHQFQGGKPAPERVRKWVRKNLKKGSVRE